MARVASLTVEHRRGAFTEGEHPVSAALVDAHGSVLERCGEPVVTTWRSGAKPFQLQGSLEALGEALTAGFAPRDLAVGAASHSGQPSHTARVTALLGRFGLGVEALRCGGHAPVHKPSEHALARAGEPYTALHNNCSGKHAFMAIATRHQGWDPDYRPAEHPLQALLRRVVDDHTGGQLRAVVCDGCGVPCFVAPLEGMARAYARLAVAGGVLGRIRDAMATQPELVSGAGRSDLALVRGAREALVSKVGAEGLLCLAVPSRGVGLVLKVRSGHEDARMAAARAVLARWLPGLVEDRVFEAFCAVRNVVGDAVGERVAVWG
ncbi:MAG: asparaginase [Deltaproteobacteria bacterium]|nr:asparaginase [Deltaproteobacteria bacterium]